MSGPPLPFPPPLRLPIGAVRDGQVFMDGRFWIDFMRMLYEKTQTVPGTTIQDLSDVALTAAQLGDLTDGGETALHKHNHNTGLTALQGGDAGLAQFYHLDSTQHTDLTDGGSSALHFHQADRDYADDQDDKRVPKTGFPVDASGAYFVTLSYNETTRTVTITPTGASFDVYVQGERFTLTGAQSIVHSADQGNHFIYYDAAGVLTHSTTVWDLHITAPVMFVAWDAANSRGIPFFENHHADTDPFIHQRLHEVDGTQFVSGFDISGYTLDDTTDAGLTFAIASGVMADEDLHTTTEALPDAGPYTIVERVGADGHWEVTRTATVPFFRSGTALQYNQNNAGTWQRTNVGNGNFTNYYVFGVPALPPANITPSPTTTEQIVIVPGQAVYATQSAANAETVSFISWGVMPFQEVVPLYRLVIGQFAAAGGTQQIKQVDRVVGSRAVITAAAATDHGSLSGLLDDDHTQYQLRSEEDAANGYAGLNAANRIIKGGIATDDYIVNSTTKGFVLLDTVDGNYYRVQTVNGVLQTTSVGGTPP